VWLAVFKTVLRDFVSQVGSIPASLRHNRFKLKMARAKPHMTERAALSALPSVHEILRRPEVEKETAEFAETYRTRLVRGVLASFRTRVQKGKALFKDRDAASTAVAVEVVAQARALRAPFPQRVINATGVVLHTNLGRAPLGDALLAPELDAIARYSSLEWNAATQKRGSRDEHVRSLIQLLTGAESGLAVNNCAGALLLALHTAAEGKDVVVSRSELVEIGGGFRIPEIIESSGRRLVEVGTTNKTRIEDYEKHARRGACVLLKVHQSNFVQRGFVESASLAELGALGRRLRAPVIVDNGSGLIAPSAIPFLCEEPSVEQGLKDGADLVVFSGDKLFGSIQAGLIAGKTALVESMRKNPLYRALRLDKLRIALLDGALKRRLSGNPETIPAWRMTTAAIHDLQDCREKLRLPNADGAWKDAQWTPLEAQVGGGSNPESSFESFGLRLVHRRHSAQELRARFAGRSVPILGYIHRNAFCLDIRTCFPDDFEEIQKALNELDELS
jgi:L-seryl-tRNA(Ser) seleniumtransferase